MSQINALASDAPAHANVFACHPQTAAEAPLSHIFAAGLRLISDRRAPFEFSQPPSDGEDWIGEASFLAAGAWRGSDQSAALFAQGAA